MKKILFLFSISILIISYVQLNGQDQEVKIFPLIVYGNSSFGESGKEIMRIMPDGNITGDSKALVEYFREQYSTIEDLRKRNMELQYGFDRIIREIPCKDKNANTKR